MGKSIHTHTATFLGRLPLLPVRNLSCAGLRCWMAVWRKCSITHRFTELTVNGVDKEIVGLDQHSYLRGIEELKIAGLITVVKAPGKCYRITVDTTKLDQQSIDFVLTRHKMQ